MKLLPFLILFFSIRPTKGQPVYFRDFSDDQGLHTYNIRVIKKDNYGFVWVGTQDGIYRYNGKDFQLIKRIPEDPNSLSGNFIFDLAPDLTGKIYVASFNGGIDAIDCQTLSVQHIVNSEKLQRTGLPHLWIKKIYCDRQKNLWIGGRDFLAVWPAGKEKVILIKEKAVQGILNVNCIVPVNDSLLCVGLDRGGMLLINIHGFSSRLISHPWGDLSTPDETVSDIFVEGENIWVAGQHLLAAGRLFNQTWSIGRPLLLPTSLSEPIRNIVRDSTGAIWCGTSDGLIRINANHGFDRPAIAADSIQYFKGSSVNHLFLDHSQNLWIGTTKMMYVGRVGKLPFRAFTGKGTGDPMDHVYALVRLSDHQIFAAGTNGLYITSTESGVTQRVKGSESLGINHCIARGTGDNWLLSTDKGMYIWNQQQGLQGTATLLKLYPEWKPFARYFFNSSLLKDSCMYWISEENEGLLKWDLRKHTIRQFKSGKASSGGLPENHFHDLAFDRVGQLWLMGDVALTVMDINRDTVVQVIRESKDGKGPNSKLFFTMYDDGRSLWFGTFGGGLNCYDKQRNSWTAITENEGLCNNVVYGILPENDSCIWVSTNKGLSRVNTLTRKCIKYFKEDGLQDNGFDEKGALRVGSFLYFGGINGFTRINTNEITLQQQPCPVYIYQISYVLNQKKYVVNRLSWDSFQFPAGAVNINIRVAALRYPQSNKIRLDYSLEAEGLSNQSIGDDNIITLSTLSPGNAFLQIGFRDEMDRHHPAVVNMAIYMTPFWYQTWWFRIGLVLIAGVLLWGLYRHRIHLLKHDHQIRSEIASDLHDEIGSTLNSVTIFAQLAETAQEKQPFLEQINFSLRQASSGLRDIIWVLDDKKDNMRELFDRVQKFALPIGNASGIQVQFNSADNLSEIVLNKSEKKNLYLICKEAVNNSFKYAHCTLIRIEFFKEQGKRVLVISDNGKGFSEAASASGNGLENMRMRAGQTGYRIAINHAMEGGTCIRLVQQ